MKVACIMPTYNRMPKLAYLVEEALECFLRQDYPNKELLIINDTAGQKLVFDHPLVRIWNTDQRFPKLSDKIRFAIMNSDAEAFVRWDDDDINLPHRLSLSVERLGDKLEWRAENHIYSPQYEPSRITNHPGNTHLMAIWRREVLDKIGGYPDTFSGDEDQAFNQALAKAGINQSGELLPPEQIFYIYRWGTGGNHLSGKGGGEKQQAHYEELGAARVRPGVYFLRARWWSDHEALVKSVAGSAAA